MIKKEVISIINNKKFYNLVFSFLIVLVFVLLVYASVNKNYQWHSEDKIYVSINGSEGTLQQAIDNNLLKGPSISAGNLSSPISNPGHDFNYIWVSINGDEETLKNSLSTGLCGISSPTTSYSSGVVVGHFATEIEITVGNETKSLQDAINDGGLAKINGNWSNWGNCSEGVKTRTCTNPSPFCGGTECVGNLTSTLGCSIDLVNGIHTDIDCTDAGGGVHNITGDIQFCKFIAENCPAGWTQYLEWSSTARKTCTFGQGAGTEEDCSGTCGTGEHDFANLDIESCYVQYQHKIQGGDLAGQCTYNIAATCYADRFEIGCY
tara:strand:+ start:785 stop:1747 length:963 start_codon:yes stop_codon:yes gene_type:complete